MSKRILDISNYEAWMLDRIEGRLSAADEFRLVEFLTAHPDLEEELEELADLSLSPLSIEHPDKESLKMPDAPDQILIAALESGSKGLEFSDEELLEFKRYQQTILMADERIIFPHKESLKKEEPTPIIPMWLTRIAIAASLIGIVLTVFFQTRPGSYMPRLSNSDLPSFDIEFSDDAGNNYAESIDVVSPEESLPMQNDIINELAQEEDGPSNDIDPEPVPLYVTQEAPANELAQETKLNIEEVPNEIDSPDVEIAQNPISDEDDIMIQEEPLIADLPVLDLQDEDPQVAEVPDMGSQNKDLDSKSNSQRFGSVLDVLKHATRDSELLALQDANQESAYVETSLKVGRFQLAVKRKKRN